SAAFEALQSESGKVGNFPAPVFFFFASVAALGWISDIRYYLSQELTRKQKLLRHIWRMNFALFMATAAFFLGQSKLFPEELREPFFLIAPVASVLLTMVYWLIRTKFFNSGDSNLAH
ncbi:MAG: hypothetical protein OQK04_06200, partial [Kangiellaceae bacterium]|nr:hypothetical protein [Kangiellaceae bacterium]